MYQVLNTCKLRICPGCFRHFRIYIITLNVRFHIHVYLVLCLFPGISPDIGRHNIQPLFSCKPSLISGRNISRHKSRLNGKCSAAAERINQYPVIPPGRKHDQRCRKVFRNGCLGGKLPVAPLMQGLSCSIKSYSHPIFFYKYSYGIIGSVFPEPLYVIYLSKPVYHCLLHNGLYV